MKGEAINPFAKNLTIHAIKLSSKKEFIDKGDWEDSDGVRTPHSLGSATDHTYTNSYLIESEQCTKLYRTKEVMAHTKGLSDRGFKMLVYVMQKLPKNAEIVEIVPADYMTEFGVSSIQTVYNAIKDLMDRGCLARYKPNRYWINPSVFFNGNRIKKYVDKVEVDFVIPIKKSK
jgi:hypothetical protein